MQRDRKTERERKKQGDQYWGNVRKITGYLYRAVTDSYYKLSDIQFFSHERNILSMEDTSGQSLTSEGNVIRMFQLTVSIQLTANI